MAVRDLRPILLLEDDEVDAMTVHRAFRELQVTRTIIHVGDGEAALEYLSDHRNERPCMALVDLNMPRMGGLEFLQAVRRDKELRKLPAVVLTTSEHDRDKYESFQLGAAGYMVKPVDYRGFVEVMRTVHDYWALSQLPARCETGQTEA